MTPTALVALVARALSRPGNEHELRDWAAVLERIPDDVGDQALVDHRATSPHPPTPSDVRRGAIAILNDRAHRAEVERHRLERETGMTADGRPLVPMPAEVRDLAAQLAARQRARDAALQPEESGVTSDGRTSPAMSHPTWPCCEHCTGLDDAIGHPPHRLPCDQCATTAPTLEGADA